MPLHLRNAPTGMMKGLGYGRGYAYYFDDPEGSFKQAYFPDEMRPRRYYHADGEGWEARVRERLEGFAKRKGGGDG